MAVSDLIIVLSWFAAAAAIIICPSFSWSSSWIVVVVVVVVGERERERMGRHRLGKIQIHPGRTDGRTSLHE